MPLINMLFITRDTQLHLGIHLISANSNSVVLATRRRVLLEAVTREMADRCTDTKTADSN